MHEALQPIATKLAYDTWICITLSGASFQCSNCRCSSTFDWCSETVSCHTLQGHKQVSICLYELPLKYWAKPAWHDGSFRLKPIDCWSRVEEQNLKPPWLFFFLHCHECLVKWNKHLFCREWPNHHWFGLQPSAPSWKFWVLDLLQDSRCCFCHYWFWKASVILFQFIFASWANNLFHNCIGTMAIFCGMALFFFNDESIPWYFTRQD